MRLNAVIFCVLAGFGSIFLVCSRSDVISDVGGGVVSDYYPALTDFVPVYLGGGDVAPSSLPAEADPAFSTTLADGPAVGVNAEGDTLAAYMQYAITADTSKYDETDSLEGVYLYFPAAGANGGSILLDWVNPLKPAQAVNRGEAGRHESAGEDFFTVCPSDADSDADCEQIPAWPREITFDGGVDSVTLPPLIAKKIFDAKKASNAAGPIAFNLWDYDGTARRIQNPYMVIVAYKVEVTTDGGEGYDGEIVNITDTVKDTVYAEASRFTVFENAGTDEARAGIAYSSPDTRRVAVFSISLARIRRELNWDRRPGEYANNIAVITINKPRPANTPGSAAGNYKIFVSDRELPVSQADSIFGTKRSSLLPASRPYNTFSISASQPSNSLNPSIQSVLDENKKDLYVYLRADSDNGAIIWDGPEPVRLETMFTPSR